MRCPAASAEHSGAQQEARAQEGDDDRHCGWDGCVETLCISHSCLDACQAPNTAHISLSSPGSHLISWALMCSTLGPSVPCTVATTDYLFKSSLNSVRRTVSSSSRRSFRQMSHKCNVKSAAEQLTRVQYCPREGCAGWAVVAAVRAAWPSQVEL